jgi:hypothetical protein
MVGMERRFLARLADALREVVGLGRETEAAARKTRISRLGGIPRQVTGPPADPDPARLATERHPLALDGVETHPEGAGLLRGHLANVGRLLVGRHTPAAHDPFRLAHHEPGKVVAVHAPPRGRQQLIGALQPCSQGLQRWRRQEALALGDETLRAVDQLVAGHPTSVRAVGDDAARQRSSSFRRP